MGANPSLATMSFLVVIQCRQQQVQQQKQDNHKCLKTRSLQTDTIALLGVGCGFEPHPTQIFYSNLKVRGAAMEATRQAVEHNPISNFIPLSVAICCSFSGLLWPI
jgi:hypothetical protein